MAAHHKSPIKVENECSDAPGILKRSSPLFQRVLKRQKTKEIPCEHFANGVCPCSEIDCDYSHSDFHWLSYQINKYINCCQKDEELEYIDSCCQKDGELLGDSDNCKTRTTNYSNIFCKKIEICDDNDWSFYYISKYTN